jgi:hypothetical protein
MGDNVTGAVGADIGTGAQNTDAIISFECDDGSPAALAATGYELNGYYHWFLPSMSELILMYENLADSDGNRSNSGPEDLNNVGGFANEWYWSSTQMSATTARVVLFDNGNQGGELKINTARVRAVRAF